MNKIDTTIIISSMLGIAAFGAIMFAIGKLPGGNPVTDTLQEVADAVS